MAYLKSITTGTTFTSASSWNLCDATSVRAYGTTTNVSSTPVYGTAWTPAANYLYVGLVFYCSLASSVANSTITIGIYTSAGTTPLASTTIRSTDMVPGYNYVKFTSPYQASTLTTVRVGMTSSAGATNVMGVSAATNFTGIVVTNTVQGIAANDSFFVLGDLTGQGTSTTATIVMDNTATTLYGSTGGASVPSVIGNKGTLSYQNNASTNYILRLQTILSVFGGAFNMGTQANPIPASSTAKLEFVCATANQFYLVIAGGTTTSVTTYGAIKTGAAKLAANVAAAATTATTDIATGWANGDQLVLPPSTRSYLNFDLPIMSGAASGTNLTFTAGLTYAHETSPSTPVATDIINLTRNVQIFGQGSGLVASLYSSIQLSGGITSFNYTSFYYIGSTGTAFNNQGFAANITNANSSCTISNCSFWGSIAVGNYMVYYSTSTTTSTFNFSNNVVYGSMYVASNANIITSNSIFNGNVIFRGKFNTLRLNITFTNNVVAGQPTSNDSNIVLNDNSVTLSNGSTLGNFSNITSYGSVTYGITLGASQASTSGTISNLVVFRNQSYGLYFLGSAPQPFIVSGGTISQNTTANISLNGSGPMYFDNITTNSASATYTTSYAIMTSGADKAHFTNSSFGNTVAESIGCILAGVNGFNVTNNLLFYNSTFGSYLTLFVSPTVVTGRSNTYGVGSMKHGGIANSNFNWQSYGTISNDSTIYNSSTYSMRMTPASPSASVLWKMMSYPVKMAINANDSVTISVFVRKSQSTGGETIYNGNQPRLMLLATPLLGYGNNTVLATASAVVGTWEQLSATFTPTVSGVYEFFVDCDGTTGWVNVDDWSTNYVRDTTKSDYWFMGMPEINLTGIPKERSSAFVY